MDNKELEKLKEQELIIEFMEKFHKEMGYYPTVVTGGNVINREFLFKLPLDLLEKQFEGYLPTFYGKTVTLRSTKRIRPIVEIRCFFSFIARCMGYSLTDIAKYMKKDHTTIMNHIKTFNNLYETQENFRDRYYKIVNIIKKSYESSAVDNINQTQDNPQSNLFS
jgi:hypothetical protein